jgi:hypothetical protein
MTKPVETITLPNGLVLKIVDRSKSIAADTTKVSFVAEMTIELEESFFPCLEDYTQTRRVFGPQVLYVYTVERTFVPSDEKDKVLSELIDTFKRDALNYLSHKDFPRRFALSKHREIQMNPYKFKTT